MRIKRLFQAVGLEILVITNLGVKFGGRVLLGRQLISFFDPVSYRATFHT